MEKKRMGKSEMTEKMTKVGDGMELCVINVSYKYNT